MVCGTLLTYVHIIATASLAGRPPSSSLIFWVCFFSVYFKQKKKKKTNQLKHWCFRRLTLLLVLPCLYLLYGLAAHGHTYVRHWSRHLFANLPEWLLDYNGRSGGKKPTSSNTGPVLVYRVIQTLHSASLTFRPGTSSWITARTPRRHCWKIKIMENTAKQVDKARRREDEKRGEKKTNQLIGGLPRCPQRHLHGIGLLCRISNHSRQSQQTQTPI